MITFTLPGEVIVKKNHQKIIMIPNGKGGKRPSIIAADRFKQWEQESLWNLKSCQKYVGPYPAFLGLFFWRQTRRIFDLVAVTESIQDLLVAGEIIEDDDMNHVVPLYLLKKDINAYAWAVDRQHPRVEIIIQSIGV